MENQELLAQVLQALKEQTDVMTQMVDEKIQASEKRMDQKLKQLSEKIEESEKRINLKIENDVSKRIDALFDGYTLTHEKQWETDRKLTELERRIEKLENAG